MWASTTEDHIGCHFCQAIIRIQRYSGHRLVEWEKVKRSFKPALLALSFLRSQFSYFSVWCEQKPKLFNCICMILLLDNCINKLFSLSLSFSQDSDVTQEILLKHHASISELKRHFMEDIPVYGPTEWDRRLSTYAPVIFPKLSNGELFTGIDIVSLTNRKYWITLLCKLMVLFVQTEQGLA